MSELGDPAIKLFGRKIPVPECQIPAKSLEDAHPSCQILVVSEVMDEHQDATETEAEDCPVEDSIKNSIPSVVDVGGKENNYQNPTRANKAMNKVSGILKPDYAADSGGQEEVQTKLGKVLPCPRCNSSDTKFCYFNNYNVNQPRHFCKNCQRYWTAGGTMRNVPIGAGRRKNHKHSSPQHPHCIKTNTAKSDAPNLMTQQVSSTSPRPCNGIREGGRENWEETSSSNSPATSQRNDWLDKERNQDVSGHSIFTPHPLQAYPGSLAYPWNLSWNGMLFTQSNTSSPSPVMVPHFCGPTVALPSKRPSYWGCVPGWEVGNLNSQSVGLSNPASPSTSASHSGCSGNGSSPTLRKHSREGDLEMEGKEEKSLWVPKTLRVNDQNEAVRSSIWATLGIRSDNKESISKGGIFKAFQHKRERSVRSSDADPVLQANPAALSRSQTFQESTQ